MKDLLTRALEAHGGLSRWREIEAFQLKREPSFLPGRARSPDQERPVSAARTVPPARVTRVRGGEQNPADRSSGFRLLTTHAAFPLTQWHDGLGLAGHSGGPATDLHRLPFSPRLFGGEPAELTLV
jgi:hypothetical protein